MFYIFLPLGPVVVIQLRPKIPIPTTNYAENIFNFVPRREILRDFRRTNFIKRYVMCASQVYTAKRIKRFKRVAEIVYSHLSKEV